MPNGTDHYERKPTSVELAQEAEDEIKRFVKENLRLIEKLKKLEKENDDLRKLLITKALDSVK